MACSAWGKYWELLLLLLLLLCKRLLLGLVAGELLLYLLLKA